MTETLKHNWIHRILHYLVSHMREFFCIELSTFGSIFVLRNWLTNEKNVAFLLSYTFKKSTWGKVELRLPISFSFLFLQYYVYIFFYLILNAVPTFVLNNVYLAKFDFA